MWMRQVSICAVHKTAVFATKRVEVLTMSLHIILIPQCLLCIQDKILLFGPLSACAEIPMKVRDSTVASTLHMFIVGLEGFPVTYTLAPLRVRPATFALLGPPSPYYAAGQSRG